MQKEVKRREEREHNRRDEMPWRVGSESLRLRNTVSAHGDRTVAKSSAAVPGPGGCHRSLHHPLFEKNIFSEMPTQHIYVSSHRRIY